MMSVPRREDDEVVGDGESSSVQKLSPTSKEEFVGPEIDRESLGEHLTRLTELNGIGRASENKSQSQILSAHSIALENEASFSVLNTPSLEVPISDRLPEPSQSVAPTRSDALKHLLSETFLLGAGFILFAVLALGGFSMAWITVNRAKTSFSYGVLSLPVAPAIGMVWTAVLVVLAGLGWLTKDRRVFLVGFVCTAVTTMLLVLLATTIQYALRDLPLWMLPVEARNYVPDIADGSGSWFASASSAVLLLWFVCAAAVVPDKP